MRNKDLPEKPCRNCGNIFQAKNYNQEFCSDTCRDNWHNDIKAKAIAMYRNRNFVQLRADVATAFELRGITDFEKLVNEILAEKLGLAP
jgi:predicted nucleic acid-binding Zn ribbon protein